MTGASLIAFLAQRCDALLVLGEHRLILGLSTSLSGAALVPLDFPLLGRMV